MPVVPVNSSVDTILSEIKDDISSVWKWDSGVWAVYLPGQENGGAAYAQSKGSTILSNIDPGEGFWINCTEAVTLD